MIRLILTKKQVELKYCEKHKNNSENKFFYSIEICMNFKFLFAYNAVSKNKFVTLIKFLLKIFRVFDRHTESFIIFFMK